MRAIQEAAIIACIALLLVPHSRNSHSCAQVATLLRLEREAALALSFELARCFDANDPLVRLAPAVAKYWITRRAVAVCIECVECLGGNGYTEKYVVARLYRDAQVNSTWEGSGNVIVLDVFRALDRDPAMLGMWRARIDELIAGATPALADSIRNACPLEAPQQSSGRNFVARLATAMQAALLTHKALASGNTDDMTVAEAFIATRLEHCGDRVFGDGDARLTACADVLIPRMAQSFGSS